MVPPTRPRTRGAAARRPDSRRLTLDGVRERVRATGSWRSSRHATPTSVAPTADDRTVNDREGFSGRESEPRPAVWGGWWRFHGNVRAWATGSSPPMAARRTAGTSGGLPLRGPPFPRPPILARQGGHNRTAPKIAHSRVRGWAVLVVRREAELVPVRVVVVIMAAELGQARAQDVGDC